MQVILVHRNSNCVYEMQLFYLQIYLCSSLHLPGYYILPIISLMWPLTQVLLMYFYEGHHVTFSKIIL